MQLTYWIGVEVVLKMVICLRRFARSDIVDELL